MMPVNSCYHLCYSYKTPSPASFFSLKSKMTRLPLASCLLYITDMVYQTTLDILSQCQSKILKVH